MKNSKILLKNLRKVHVIPNLYTYCTMVLQNVFSYPGLYFNKTKYKKYHSVFLPPKVWHLWLTITGLSQSIMSKMVSVNAHSAPEKVMKCKFSLVNKKINTTRSFYENLRLHNTNLLCFAYKSVPFSIDTSITLFEWNV